MRLRPFWCYKTYRQGYMVIIWPTCRYTVPVLESPDMKNDRTRAGAIDVSAPNRAQQGTMGAADENDASARIAAPPDHSDAEATENELWVGRTDWKHYAGRLGLWATGSMVAVILIGWWTARAEWLTFAHAFWAVTALLLISGACVVGPVALTILSHRYRLTSQRLFIVRGILSQTVDQTELIRVDDVRLHKNFLDRVFGLGSVVILSTDATDAEIIIPGIRNPEKVAEAIRANMRVLRKKSLYVESL